MKELLLLDGVLLHCRQPPSILSACLISVSNGMPHIPTQVMGSTPSSLGWREALWKDKHVDNVNNDLQVPPYDRFFVTYLVLNQN